MYNDKIWKFTVIHTYVYICILLCSRIPRIIYVGTKKNANGYVVGHFPTFIYFFAKNEKNALKKFTEKIPK